MFLYIITNIINGKKYIGQTRQSLEHRWSQHSTSKRHHGYLPNAIRKYGRESFIIEPLLEVTDQNVLNELEAEFIERFCTRAPNGYNLMSGGRAHYQHSDTRAKLSAIHSGKKLTEEHKQHIREGLQKSPAHQAALLRRSQTYTQEQREASRKLLTGNTYFKGRRHSEETRRKMSESAKKRELRKRNVRQNSDQS